MISDDKGKENENDDEKNEDDDDVNTVMTFNTLACSSPVAFSSNRKQLQSCNLRKRKKKRNTSVRYSEYVHVHTWACTRL